MTRKIDKRINDLEKATKQAYAMVTYFGMSEKIGNISFYDSTGQSEYAFNKPYSDTTAQLIDSEAKAIIEKAYERAKEILVSNRNKHTELAELLLEKEVIFAEDLERIFGPRKYQPEELKAFTSKDLGLKKPQIDENQESVESGNSGDSGDSGDSKESETNPKENKKIDSKETETESPSKVTVAEFKMKFPKSFVTQ